MQGSLSGRISVVLCFAGLLSAGPGGDQVKSPAHLFKQLKSEGTTDQATAELVSLGPENIGAKNYLARNLPAIIDQQPRSRNVWLNSVRLAGIFRLTEAVPALTKWINASLETGGTIAENNRLDPFPCARALVQIGEPAVPALIETLEKGDKHHRWFAYRVLFIIGSPRAIGALRGHLTRESDPSFKLEIQRALDEQLGDS